MVLAPPGRDIIVNRWTIVLCPKLDPNEADVRTRDGHLQRLVEEDARHEAARGWAVEWRPAGDTSDSSVAWCNALALWGQLIDCCGADPDPLAGRAATHTFAAEIKSFPLTIWV